MIEKQQWNNFVLKNRGSFLQSFEWGEFQKAIGHQIWRLQEKGLKALVIKHNLPYLKNYLYCGRGPVISQSETAERKKQLFDLFLERVKEIADREKSIFFKIEPEQDTSCLTQVSFKPSVKQIQPSSKTVILNLDKSEDELLQAMHSKTRYNIRLALKKGVVVKEAEDIDAFYNLLQKTAQRDKFYTHTKKRYEKLMETLGQAGLARLFLAQIRDKIIAANIVIFWNKQAVYLHGASDYDYRQVMAPYALQWQVICQAKKSGCKSYDFWGIDEKKWPGVTRFKKGFGAKVIVYPGSFDLIYSPFWYAGYKIVRQVL